MIKSLLRSTAILSLVVTTCFATGCRDVENTHLPISPKFMATIETQTPPPSRAYNTSWEDNDAIGIFMLNELDDILTQNAGYATPNGDGIFSSISELRSITYPLSGSVDFVAYYPYKSYMGGVFDIPVNVANQVHPSYIDLMTTDRVIGKSRTNPDVLFTFHHRLSKLIVNVTIEGEATQSLIAATGLKVLFTGSQVEGSYNLVSNTLTASGDATDITLKDINVNHSLYEAIVLPSSTVGLALQFVTDNSDEFGTYVFQTATFDSGYKYIYNVTISSNGISVGTSSIEDWLEGNGVGEDVDITVTEQAIKLVGSLESTMKEINTLGYNRHNDFGYPSLIIARNYLGEDYTTNSAGGYFWWNSWYGGLDLGQNMTVTKQPWQWYFKMNEICDKIIKLYPLNNLSMLTEQEYVYLGTAYFYKAMLYLDMVQLYIQGRYYDPDTDTYNDGLTVPWVDHNTTAEQAINNPRRTASYIYQQIDKLLSNALNCLRTALTPASIVTPSLSATYGLMARYNLLQGSWSSAYIYAMRAMNGHSRMTESQYTDPTTGFNTPNSSWIWGIEMKATDEAVKSGVVNWTSWMSPEIDYGYMGSVTSMYPLIDAHLYSMISDTDWRKKVFVRPGGQATALSNSPYKHYFSNYTAIKFRPGSGNYDDYIISAQVSIPLMRYEEMYLIAIEATGRMGNLSNGLASLNNFGTSRDVNYDFTTDNLQDFITEVVRQRRIELWGEGFATLDIKRLNLPVIRAYTFNGGTQYTNHPTYRFNSSGAPDRMNYVIHQTAFTNNPGLGENNPDPVAPTEPDISQWVQFE